MGTGWCDSLAERTCSMQLFTRSPASVQTRKKRRLTGGARRRRQRRQHRRAAAWRPPLLGSTAARPPVPLAAPFRDAAQRPRRCDLQVAARAARTARAAGSTARRYTDAKPTGRRRYGGAKVARSPASARPGRWQPCFHYKMFQGCDPCQDEARHVYWRVALPPSPAAPAPASTCICVTRFMQVFLLCMHPTSPD